MLLIRDGSHNVRLNTVSLDDTDAIRSLIPLKSGLRYGDKIFVDIERQNLGIEIAGRFVKGQGADARESAQFKD